MKNLVIGLLLGLISGFVTFAAIISTNLDGFGDIFKSMSKNF